MEYVRRLKHVQHVSGIFMIDISGKYMEIYGLWISVAVDWNAEVRHARSRLLDTVRTRARATGDLVAGCRLGCVLHHQGLYEAGTAGLRCSLYFTSTFLEI